MIHKSLGLGQFRTGVAPSLSAKALAELRDACRRNDPALIQGRTTQPPPLLCLYDWPCEGGCAISYAGWKGDELGTVGEVESFFARVCFESDGRLGAAGEIRHFLNWYDDTPREEALKLLADEIDLILTERGRDEADKPIVV